MRSINNAPIIVAKNKNVDTSTFVNDLESLAGAYDGAVNYAQKAVKMPKNLNVHDMAYDEGQFSLV